MIGRSSGTVANRATDDPRLFAGEELLDELTHRRPLACARRGSESDPADELVVDRPRDARVILGEDAVAQDRHRRPDRLLVLELDRERVHRDGADDAAQLPAHTNLGAGQVAPEAVRVADGNDPDPGRPVGHERAAVTGARPRFEPLHLGEVAPPRERRLEAVGARVLAERREPVQRDPAAGGVEARRRKPQRSGAVGDVRASALDRARSPSGSARSAGPRRSGRSRRWPGATSGQPLRPEASAARRAPTGPCRCRASGERAGLPGSRRPRSRAPDWRCEPRRSPGWTRWGPSRGCARERTRLAAPGPPATVATQSAPAPSSSTTAATSTAPCP